MRAGPKQASVEASFDQVPDGIGTLERIADATLRIDAAADDPPLL